MDLKKDLVLNTVVMTKEFKEAVDNGNEFGVLLTDLSKAFD